MTKGDEIWAAAVGVVGIAKLSSDPLSAVAEIGRIIIQEIDSLNARCEFLEVGLAAGAEVRQALVDKLSQHGISLL